MKKNQIPKYNSFQLQRLRSKLLTAAVAEVEEDAPRFRRWRWTDLLPFGRKQRKR